MPELLAFLLHPKFISHFIDYEDLKQSLQTFVLNVYTSVTIWTWGKSKYFYRIIEILDWVKTEAFNV